MATTVALVSGGSLATLVVVAGLITVVASSILGAASPNPSSAPSASGEVVAQRATPVPVEPTAPVDSPPLVAPAAPTVTAHFSAFAAKRAFDIASRDVVACNRGTRWGVAYATITFASDGSVQDVQIGPPFSDTPTGQCVGDLLGAVHIPAFGGAPVVYVTQFYVAPR
jgi:hypothetical protein